MANLTAWMFSICQPQDQNYLVLTSVSVSH